MKPLLLLLAVCLTLTGCLSSTPSESDVKKAIELTLVDSGMPFLELTDFKKTNGMEVSDKVYKADVSYTLVFTKSSAQVEQELAESLAKRKASKMEKLSAGMQLSMLKMSLGGSWKQGDTRQVDNNYELNKTEQGWRVAEG